MERGDKATHHHRQKGGTASTVCSLLPRPPASYRLGFSVNGKQLESMYHILLRIMHSRAQYMRLRFWPKLSGEKNHFNFLIQLCIYLIYKQNLIIVFQGIILHMAIIIAF